jgi:hypothetical protein
MDAYLGLLCPVDEYRMCVSLVFLIVRAFFATIFAVSLLFLLHRDGSCASQNPGRVTDLSQHGLQHLKLSIHDGCNGKYDTHVVCADMATSPTRARNLSRSFATSTSKRAKSKRCVVCVCHRDLVSSEFLFLPRAVKSMSFFSSFFAFYFLSFAHIRFTFFCSPSPTTLQASISSCGDCTRSTSTRSVRRSPSSAHASTRRAFTVRWRDWCSAMPPMRVRMRVARVD